MRIYHIAKIVATHVGGRVGSYGRPEKRKSHNAVLSRNAVFARINQCNAAALLRHVAPFMVADLKARLLPACVSVGFAADYARRGVAKQLTAENVTSEFRLDKLMLFVPINYIFNFNAS